MAGLNNSIFDLPNTLEEIRRPEDVIKVYTRKVIPKSSSSLAQFPGSDIVFDFTLSANQHWLPSRSFCVIKDSYYRGVANVATQPLNSSNMAPAFNSQDNLFDGCELTIGGFSLGNKTKLSPQISACDRRLSKSAGFLDGVGASVHTFIPDYGLRKQNIISDGVVVSVAQQLTALTGTVTIVNNDTTLVGVGTAFLTELQVGDIVVSAGNQAVTIRTIADNTNATTSSDVNAGEAGVAFSKKSFNEFSDRSNRNDKLYQPPLGVFRQGKALPPARYELTLRPKPDILYKQSAIESVGAALPLAGGARVPVLPTGDYEYVVDDIVFYMAVVENYERVPDKMSYVLDLEETEVLPRAIAGGGTFTENFTVSKSTFGLSVAVQDKRAGQNSLYSPSLYKMEADGQQSITSLRIDYAGQTRPNPQKTLAFGAGVDYEGWGYAETAVEDLAYYDTGGALTKSQWRDLGELFHYQWRKTGDDISTDVNVEVTYGAFANGPHNLLLFHHFRRVIEFTIENNQVINFLAQDA